MNLMEKINPRTTVAWLRQSSQPVKGYTGLLPGDGTNEKTA
jgi:hypothetical protein